MARIKEYGAQVTPLGPSRGGDLTADNFGAQTGRSLQRLGQAVTQASDRIDARKYQNDVSNINANLSEVQRSFTDKWDNAAKTAQPGDTKFHEKFLSDLDNDMSKVSEGIETEQGRQYFQENSNKLKFKFQEDAKAVQSTLAGIQAKSQYQKAQNNSTSSLVSNPTLFDVTLDLHNSGVDALVTSGLLPAAKAQELKDSGTKELAESAAKGWIKQDPWKAKTDIQGGKWDQYVDGQKKYSLIEEAEQEIRSRKVEAERNEALSKKVEKEKVRVTQAEFLTKSVNYSLTAKEVMDSNLPQFGSGSKNQFINMLKRQSKTDTDRTDPVKYNEIFDRIHSDDPDDKFDDPNELVDYSFGNGLSQDDVSFLSQEMQRVKVQPENIESKGKKKIVDTVRSNLTRTNKLTGFIDEKGEEKLHGFNTVLSKEYQREIDKGTSPADLFDPTSPKYLGRLANQFQKSGKEVMGELATEKRKKEQINGLNKSQKDAYDWANTNRKDPRSAAVLKKLGFGGKE